MLLFTMSDAWYSEIPESEEDRLYTESVKRIQSGVEQGMSFEKAAGLIESAVEALRAEILGDALKVLIAKFHFSEGMPLDKLAKKLGLPLARLENAKNEMLAEVEQAAIERYKEESGSSGNA
ncbi:MAG: hypothetical protein M0Z75_11805 [Nitrospiraceae bacterium]|nr:hypothetical protein [Nitrospiraceae bacterium]